MHAVERAVALMGCSHAHTIATRARNNLRRTTGVGKFGSRGRGARSREAVKEALRPWSAQTIAPKIAREASREMATWRDGDMARRRVISAGARLLRVATPAGSLTARTTLRRMAVR
jgi:hypothetical protein